MTHPEKPVVLLVDDEPFYLELASDQLAGDFEVLTAGGVDEALALLKDAPVQAVLCDYRMSPKHGTALLKNMAETRHAAVRILVTANRELAEQDPDFKAANIAHFADKPLKVKSFIPALRALLKDQKQQSP